MPKTKKLSNTDKNIKRIEEWGPLSLFYHLKETWDNKMSKDRRIIETFPSDKYEGSNLECHDKYVAAVNQVFDKEFKKLYERVKRTNRSKRSKD